MDGQIFGPNRIALGEDDGALHDVFKLTHVARPGVALHQGHRRRVKVMQRLLEHLREVFEEVARDLRNVLGVILQGR